MFGRTRLMLSVLALVALHTPQDYVGRYYLSETKSINVFTRNGKLYLRPVLWSVYERLDPDGEDKFRVLDRPHRTAIFKKGKSVTISGFGSDDGTYSSGTQKTTTELLLEGDFRGALARADQRMTLDEQIDLANQVTQRWPRKAEYSAKFLSELQRRSSSSSPKLLAGLGDALMETGDRSAATQAYQAAILIDPENEDAKLALQMLGVIPKTKGWEVPFRMAELFQPPKASEIEKVDKDWKSRDLNVKDVKVEETFEVDLGHTRAQARIVSHTVLGSKHYGVIVVPNGAKPRSCSVLLEAKGVSWNYFPLSFPSGTKGPEVVGEDQSNWIYVIPSYRGEKLIANGKEYLSEGDRTNNWDGATDDILALLNVALETVPEADPIRVAVLGKSRGGSVALLAGIRDKRISRVVNWSGPVGWFNEMGQAGWTQRELVEAGLSVKAAPNQIGGQFLERFLAKAIEGKEDLASVRHRMIASSAIYFVDRLPATLSEYGDEDPVVTILNPRALIQKTRASNKVKTWVDEGYGHDADPELAIERARQFLKPLSR